MNRAQTISAGACDDRRSRNPAFLDGAELHRSRLHTKPLTNDLMFCSFCNVIGRIFASGLINGVFCLAGCCSCQVSNQACGKAEGDAAVHSSVPVAMAPREGLPVLGVGLLHATSSDDQQCRTLNCTAAVEAMVLHNRRHSHPS